MAPQTCPREAMLKGSWLWYDALDDLNEYLDEMGKNAVRWKDARFLYSSASNVDCFHTICWRDLFELT